ncbi:hypothetical protein GCM10010124_22620 [Pilimelia terevasa]|uniref:Uncharacterized protein n=1 Tax=Pilimelia terevasa TaxID=53372 RepID=A0A8J3BPH0_9ACTN|nr:hypothetical protein [Pilimelia terevasa]GGK29317.1 hypothetical protein GCM10010124_22620 [Pilimelia terevasa]
MDKKFARTDRPAPAPGDHTPDILHALLSPVGAHRLPDSLPGAPAPRAYHGGACAVAATPVLTRPHAHPEVAMSEPTTRRRPLAISDRPAPDRHGGGDGAPAAAETLLRPVPLAPLADPAPARGRARVPRMREPEGMRVDLLGVWHARDRHAPLPAVIWEELTAAHPELFDEDGHGAAA